MLRTSFKWIGLLVLGLGLVGLALPATTLISHAQAVATSTPAFVTSTPSPTSGSQTPASSAGPSATPRLSQSQQISTMTAKTRAVSAQTRTAAPTVNRTAASQQLTKSAIERATGTALAHEVCLNAGGQTPRDWDLVVCDPFLTNQNNRWSSGAVNNALTMGTMNVQDGAYRWELTSGKGAFQRAGVRSRTLQDFYASVKIKHAQDQPKSGVGLYMRSSDTGYYAFIVRGDGTFFASRRADGQWFPLLEGTASAAFKSGEQNRITVEARGDRFAFYVNDKLVGTGQDSALKSGVVGLAADLPPDTTKARFEFDDFLLLAPNAKSKARPTIPVAQNAAPPTPTPQSAPTSVPPPPPTEPPSNGCAVDAGNAGIYAINQFGGLMTLTLLDHEYRLEPNTEQLIQVPGGREFTVSVSVQGVGKTNFGPLTLQPGECVQYRPTSGN